MSESKKWSVLVLTHKNVELWDKSIEELADELVAILNQLEGVEC